KIQLSNATGSFSSPIDIGSITNVGSGNILCVIPANTPTGSNYRLRIIASSFADTADCYTVYKIGSSVEKPFASNNGPVCSNSILQLAAYSSTQNVLYKWTGPGNYTSEQQNPVITSPISTDSGDYIVTAYLHGCISADTTTAVVKAGSGPTGVSATANGPICAND